MRKKTTVLQLIGSICCWGTWHSWRYGETLRALPSALGYVPSRCCAGRSTRWPITIAWCVKESETRVGRQILLDAHWGVPCGGRRPSALLRRAAEEVPCPTWARNVTSYVFWALHRGVCMRNVSGLNLLQVLLQLPELILTLQSANTSQESIILSARQKPKVRNIC